MAGFDRQHRPGHISLDVEEPQHVLVLLSKPEHADQPHLQLQSTLVELRL
jgi:hypothetical protein